MAYSRRRRDRDSRRRRVPWAGWGKISPKGYQRTVMKRDCGKKCFLGPDKSFPICAADTCDVNDKGLWAAYIRAREWGKKPSSYKGKARPTHRRYVYTRVARDAKRMLEDRGYYVGKGGSSCGTKKSKKSKKGGMSCGTKKKESKKGGMRKCPRGYTHKLEGQKRRWEDGVDRIVRHGRYTRKCYRKRR